MKLKNKKFLLVFSLCAVLLLVFITRMFNGKKTEEFVPLKVAKVPLLITIQATGNIEPMNKVEILPPVAGRIDKILTEEGERVEQGKIIAWMSSTNRAALLDITRSRSPSEYEEWEKMYQPTPIMAPVSGLIISKKTVPGQTVSAQSVLFEMSDQLIARAQVDETDIEKIKQKMTAFITVDAHPNKEFKARVDKISHQSELVNNVNIYSIELALEDSTDDLRSGMTANVSFVIAEKETALVIPIWAVQGREEEAYTVLDSHKKSKQVQLGLSDGKNVEVLSGVQEGEEIYVPKFDLKVEEKNSSPFFPAGRMGRKPTGGGGRR